MQSPLIASDLSSRVRAWLDAHIVPAEAVLDSEGAAATGKADELIAAARRAELWGLFYPGAWGGRIDRLTDYVPVAEEEGRSEHGPMIFGSEAVIDAHMLDRHGSAAVKERYLAPLAAGLATPAYGMSEPGSIGSIPSTIQTSAVLEDGHWRIDGRKWFICRAGRAAFVTVVARTRPDAPADDALSMIIVPTDTPGFRVERELDVFGRHQGQCEISFTNVRVPAHHVLGRPHAGMGLMRERLVLGRLVRASHWLGLGQRCFDLMVERIRSPRGELAALADKQLMRQHVFEAHLSLASARALVRAAAEDFDAGRRCDVSANLAKVAAARALNRCADSAVQVYGAEGVCAALSPLAGIYRAARAARILDGTDEALINSVGRQLVGIDVTAP